MTARPPISFIVPVYNYDRFLEAAVTSIIDGNLQPGDEIIIVNDASTDNTARVMTSLAERNKQIRCFTHRYNKGCFNAGLNTAIEVAKHELFFGLAADNLLVPTSIEQLADFMREKKADVAAFQEVRFFTNDPNKPTHSWFFTEECTLADALAGHEWPGSSGHYLFTRESWLRGGRCDESFGGLDSWAFGIQQLATNSKMVALPGTFYLHRWGHESLFYREARKDNLSLKALPALLPFLNLLEEESVNYLFSPAGRTRWFENLKTVPLKVHNHGSTNVGKVVQYSAPKAPFFRRLRSYLARKLVSEH